MVEGQQRCPETLTCLPTGMSKFSMIYDWCEDFLADEQHNVLYVLAVLVEDTEVKLLRRLPVVDVGQDYWSAKHHCTREVASSDGHHPRKTNANNTTYRQNCTKS